MERYQEEAGHYVLYLDGVRALATDVVALLVDAGSGRVVTHGDPQSVRREYDALRAAGDPDAASGWLLLEGRPALATVRSPGKWDSMSCISPSPKVSPSGSPTRSSRACAASQ